MPRRRSATPTLPVADFLVIGSGVAGLRAAIGLSRAGRVLVLTKGSPAEGSSIYAQGGVAVASEEDDIALHREDTVRAGKGCSGRKLCQWSSGKARFGVRKL